MEVPDDKEHILIKYLLNELSKAENEELEDEMVLDPELSDRMQVLEMNLIDSYVTKQMNPAEKSRFEKGFLLFPENRAKLTDARAFHESLVPARTETFKVPRAVVDNTAQPAWFFSVFRLPAPALALAALTLALTVTVGLLVVPRLKLGNVSTNRNPPAGVPQVTPSRENDKAENPPGTTEITPTNRSGDRARPLDKDPARRDPYARAEAVVSMIEIRGRVSSNQGGARGRGEGSDPGVEPRLLKIPAGAHQIKLNVSLIADKYFENNLDCSVDISDSKFQPIFPGGEGNYLRTRVERHEDKFPYQLSISVPTAYLKQGRLYYFRIIETDSLTPFKVRFDN